MKVTKIESCKSGKFPILKVVAKVEGNFSISCQVENWQVEKLPSCQVAKLPKCQIAKLQVAKLWTCDHGAKSLSFLFYYILDKSKRNIFNSAGKRAFSVIKNHDKNSSKQ